MTTMTYSQLFNQALELLDERGADEAYELVKSCEYEIGRAHV